MTLFNTDFFKHFSEYRKHDNGKGAISLQVLITLFNSSIFTFVLSIFEKIITLILNLPIPIYNDVVLQFITTLPGLPKMFGCYLRGLYYKGRVRYMGSNILIDQGAVISHPESIHLSDFSFIDKYVIIAANGCFIGKRVHIAPFVMISGGGEFVIEDYACIATGSSIITGTETLKYGTRSSGPMVPLSQRDVKKGKVIIKKDAFIGARATILTDVVIEEGTVIGANTTVTKNTEPWTIYVSSGGKAIEIKKRKKLNLPDL